MGARPLAYGLLGLKPWEFVRYTVREFEEAVAGAQVRYMHAFDLVMRHALATGQWAKPVTFEDLTGHRQPWPLDPRAVQVEPEMTEEEQERGMRAWMAQAEAQIRANTRIKIEGDPDDGDPGVMAPV